MRKEYKGKRSNRVNKKRLGIVIICAVCLIAVVVGIGWFVYRTFFYDPFPEDPSMTKEVGHVTKEIDQESGWMIRYPTFDDQIVDETVQTAIEDIKKDAGEGKTIIVDYRSSDVYDHYTSVLIKETVKEDNSSKVLYHSINYDKKQKKILQTDDILRGQYCRDLLGKVKKDNIDALEITKKEIIAYLSNDSEKKITYEDHKEYIALTDPNIPSLFQQDPLEVAAKQKVDPNKPMVALTFDDGPNPNTTPELLDILKKYDARATFFMVGTNVSNYPDIVKQIYQDGHEIGNHSWAHEDLSLMKDGNQIIDNYQKTDDKIFAACGHDPKYVRPPYGKMSDVYDKAVERESVLWTVDTRDWESHNAKAIQSIIEKYVGDGSIILLHDIHADSVESMKSVIPMLQEKGYQLVTIDDLLRYRYSD